MTTFSGTFRFWEGVQNDPAIANAWGTPNSFNMTLVEAPLGGAGGVVAVNIAGLSTFSLSTANGAADQSRPFLQQYIGALTSACTVTIPNLPRAMGWAQNLTTGGNNVVLTAGAGATVTVPPDGRWYWYQTDGATNVVQPNVAFGTAIAGPVVGTNGNFSGGVTATGFGGNSIVLSNNMTSLDAQVGVLNKLNSGSAALVVEQVRAAGSPVAEFLANGAIPNLVTMIVRQDRADGFLIDFAFGASIVGSIHSNGATTTYATTSDQTLKIDDGVIDGWQAVQLLLRLRPRWFRWKSAPDGLSEPGFFAQQVYRLWPWAVTKRIRGKGSKPWQMDNAKLVPLLTAALQAALIEIEAQNRRITRLEGKVG